MIFSLSGFWTALISVFFGGILVCFLFQFMGGYRKIYASAVLLCILLILLRISLPVEIRFAHPILLSRILPGVRDLLLYPVIQNTTTEITILHILLAMWGMAALYNLYRLGNEYHQMCRYLKNLSNVSPALTDKLRGDEKLFHIRPAIRYKTCSDTNVPYVFGVLHPVVVFPSYMTAMPYEKLFLAVTHEWGHIKHIDPLLKVLLRAFFCIFWWIPFRTKLCTLAENVMELRADAFAVRKLDSNYVTDYMCILLKITKYATHPSKSGQLLNFFARRQVSTLRQRFDVLNTPPAQRGRTIFFAIICIGMFFLSYFVVFEPHYKPNDGTFTCFDTCLIIDNGDDTYDMYMDGAYVALINNIEFIPGLEQQGIQVIIKKR